MNFFLKNKKLLPNIIYTMLTILMLGVGGIPAIIFGKKIVSNSNAKEITAETPAILQPFFEVLFVLIIGATLLELFLNIFNKDYRKFRLRDPRHLGIKKVEDERADYVVGEAARRAFSFSRTVGLAATILTVPVLWIAILGGLMPNKIGFYIISDKFKMPWTLALQYFIFLSSPLWLTHIGSEIIFRRTLHKLKFSSEKDTKKVSF